jgi:glycerophosphoryl diester phosphodiesterase
VLLGKKHLENNQQIDYAFCSSLNAQSINISLQFATKQQVEEILQQWFDVYVYTVNCKKQAHYLQAIWVQAIFSDIPHIIEKILQSDKIAI